MTLTAQAEQSAGFGSGPDTPSRQVLVAEDDPAIAEQLTAFLEDHGFDACVVANGLRIEPEVRRIEPCAVLLDVSLPGIDGFEVCRALRRFSPVPIIMVSARDDEFDRLLGLESGADDYVCKPFSPRELLARMKAVLRRVEGRLHGGMELHGFAIDEAARRVGWRGDWAALTPVELRLFRRFASRPGHVFSRGELQETVDPQRAAATRVIDSHVKNLRRKIAAIRPEGSAIVSVYGAGYRFDPNARDVG